MMDFSNSFQASSSHEARGLPLFSLAQDTFRALIAANRLVDEALEIIECS